MAVYVTNDSSASVRVSFETLWEHYLRTQFLYPTKLEKLAPFQSQITRLWPRLLECSGQVFQVHCAAQGGEVASSLSCFRDTARRFVIQHAASALHPDLLIECLLSMTVSLSQTAADYFIMYYRDSKRWPSRIARLLSARQGSGACYSLMQDYLHAEAAHCDWPANVERVAGELPDEALTLLMNQWGALRMKSLGLECIERGQLQGLFQGAGLSRNQRILIATESGRVAGVAVLHMGSSPINLSLLCNRVEVAIAESADQPQITTSLLQAARRAFAEDGIPHFTCLLRPDDAGTTIKGYHATGRQYASFLWSRDLNHGFASTAIALARWFETLGERKARTRARAANQPDTIP